MRKLVLKSGLDFSVIILGKLWVKGSGWKGFDRCFHSAVGQQPVLQNFVSNSNTKAVHAQ